MELIEKIIDGLILIKYAVPDYVELRNEGMTDDQAVAYVNDSVYLAIEALEAIKGGVVPKELHDKAMEIQYERLRAPQRWIPVSERLPEKKDSNEFGYVLVVTRYGSIRTDSAKWVASEEGAKFFTHWMPLPEPPGGE